MQFVHEWVLENIPCWELHALSEKPEARFAFPLIPKLGYIVPNSNKIHRILFV